MSQLSAVYILHIDTSDFTALNQVFQLRSTQFVYNFNITITNDDILETTEEFSAHLTPVTQDSNIDTNPDMATVKIADDDGKNTVALPCAVFDHGDA